MIQKKNTKPMSKKYYRHKTAAGELFKRNRQLIFVLVFAVAGAGMLLITKASPAGQQIVSNPSGRCLDVIDGQVDNGTGVQIYDCTGGVNQQWQFYSDNTIRSTQSGRCLDVTGQQTDNGTYVEIWDCNGGSNQQWQRYGDYTIRSAQSSRCLDVRDARTDNGANIQIWDCNGGSNQQWTVILPSSSSSPPPEPAPMPAPAPSPSPAPAPAPTPSQPAPSSPSAPAPTTPSTPSPAPSSSSPAPSSSSPSPSLQGGNNTSSNPATTSQPKPSTPAIQGSGVAKAQPVKVPTSIPDTTPPTTPTNFSAKPDNQGVSIELSWEAATDNSGLVHYQLEHSTDQKDWQALTDDKEDTFYTDSDVKFATHYYYRLRAQDATGNNSEYVMADALAGNFTSNATPDKETVIKDEQNNIQATIPAGALSENASCAITSLASQVIGPSLQGYIVVSGPFQVLCKKADSSVVSSFNQPITISWTLRSPKNVGGALEYYGNEDSWSKLTVSSRNNKTHTDIFALDKGTAFIAMGKLKKPSILLKVLLIVFGIFLIIALVVFILFRRKRRQEQAMLDDYRHKMSGV